VRHSTFYIYYCRFSVAYLQKFVQYGLNVGDHLATNEKMSLLRSNPYDCTVTAERVAFFELMARLLFYVTSGEAEIRCLANNTDNPLWEVISFKVRTDSRISRGVTEFSMINFKKVKHIFPKKTSMKIRISVGSRRMEVYLLPELNGSIANGGSNIYSICFHGVLCVFVRPAVNLSVPNNGIIKIDHCRRVEFRPP